MNAKAESQFAFPVPIARRVCRDGISVTTVIPSTLLLTDDEARQLIEQLQVALAVPAPVDPEVAA